jgi:tRNA G10  N-methylase Trm11
MNYIYANRPSYEDFAPGRTLYHAPGATNFPARLAEELMGRCLDFLGRREGVVLLDPLCGAGSLIAVAALTHAGALARVRGTDADPCAVLTAQKNLALLAPGGLAARVRELREMGERFARPSYLEAAESAARLARLLPERGVAAEAFVADAFRLPDDGFRADIVLTDFPYGGMKVWTSGDAGAFLAAVRKKLSAGGVVCAVMDKAQKCASEGFIRLERQSVGKRRYEIYQLGKDES